MDVGTYSSLSWITSSIALPSSFNTISPNASEQSFSITATTTGFSSTVASNTGAMYSP